MKDRTKWKLCLNVTDYEHSQIKNKARELGMTVPKYLRHVLKTLAGIDFRDRQDQSKRWPIDQCIQSQYEGKNE